MLSNPSLADAHTSIKTPSIIADNSKRRWQAPKQICHSCQPPIQTSRNSFLQQLACICGRWEIRNYSFCNGCVLLCGGVVYADSTGQCRHFDVQHDELWVYVTEWQGARCMSRINGRFVWVLVISILSYQLQSTLAQNFKNCSIF